MDKLQEKTHLIKDFIKFPLNAIKQKIRNITTQPNTTSSAPLLPSCTPIYTTALLSGASTTPSVSTDHNRSQISGDSTLSTYSHVAGSSRYSCD